MTVRQDPDEIVSLLLAMARTSVSDGNGEGALSAVIHAIRLTQGEGAILDVLGRAKRAAIQDEDARALEEAERICNLLINQDTLLAENGRQGILRAAFSDGSSVLCSGCGALVAKARTDQHSMYWCTAISNRPGAIDVDMDESDTDSFHSCEGEEGHTL